MYFDKEISRYGTFSASYDKFSKKYGRSLTSLAVVEMDFETCPDVKAAIVKSAQHGIYSYAEVFPEFMHSCASWFTRQHGWSFDPSQVIFTPRIIELLAALFAHEFPRAKVGTFAPYYAPIVNTLSRLNIEVKTIALERNEDGVWRFNEMNLHRLFRDIDVFILTNPHNPTGRVWSYEELKVILSFAERYKVLVISDDIHCDISRSNVRWIPIAKIVSEEKILVDVITCVSPAKSFNVAGIETAAAIIANPGLRAKAIDALHKNGVHNPNFFALPTAIAAWNSDGRWMSALNDYISENIEHSVQRLCNEVPDITIEIPEGTYLLWVQLPRVFQGSVQKISDETAVILSPGENFGKEFCDYFRMATALPSDQLDLALTKIIAAFGIQNWK